MIQTRLVADYIENTLPEAEVRLLTMKTTGDRILDRPLEAVGGKGLFVKELDRALLEGRTELSVHSLKDLPMELPPRLPILGFSRREDPRDVLVPPAGKTHWDRSKPLGRSSKRRILQLQRLYPEVEAALVRGQRPDPPAEAGRGSVWSPGSGGGGAEAAGTGGPDLPVFFPPRRWCLRLVRVSWPFRAGRAWITAICMAFLTRMQKPALRRSGPLSGS